MKTGILLLALGASDYGQWARNMAISLRYHTYLPITLIHDGKGITSIELTETYKDKPLFDEIRQMDEADYHLGEGRYRKFAPGYAKTNLYKYTPYDRTIYADVDGLCCNELDSLIEKSKERPFTSHVWDYGKKEDTDWGIIMMWAKPDVVWDHFELRDNDRYPFLNSSLMVFDEQGKEVFNLASQLMLENPLPIAKFKTRWGKGNQPDELFFNAACAKLGIDPGLSKHPIYFRPMKVRGERTKEKHLEGYYFLGCWGDKDMNHRSVYEMYDKLMQKYTMAGSHRAFNKAHQLMKRKFIRTN